MKKCLAIAAILLPCITGLPAQASSIDATATLKAKLQKIDNIKSDFTQKVTDINHKVIQTGAGVFALAHPNQFYWHLTAPDESLIVADGKDVWIYNPFAEEVSVMDTQQAITASPIALLVHSDDATWSQYLVKQTDNCFSISPKTLDANVTSVAVCFDDKTLTKIQLEDQQGNISDFALSNQHALSAEDKALFKFTLPEGVDVDDQRTSANDQ